VTAENPDWAKLGDQPGLCLNCRYAKINETRRGTAYLRCLRSAWDARLARYPRLPVTECVGFEDPANQGRPR
jgi:propionyl-CoA synthetase